MISIRSLGSASMCLLSLLLVPPCSAAVLFSESFRTPSIPGTDGIDVCYTTPESPGNYLFPTGWLLRNVDNLTPNATVSWVNDAWEVREFPSGGLNNCVAFSTSYYLHTLLADDFMWSPPITLPTVTPWRSIRLSWKATSMSFSLRDGYEVRVMSSDFGAPTGGTGDLGNQLTNSTQVFWIAAEENDWTPRSVGLDTFGGHTVYIGFRNNSFDRFLLGIDDLVVESLVPNVTAQAPVSALPYTRVPADLGYTPELGVVAANTGAFALSDVQGSAQLLRNAVPVGTATAATAVPALAIGAAAALDFPTALGVMDAPGIWTVRYGLAVAEPEAAAELSDNSIEAAAVTVGGDELARHEGSPSSYLGIGQGEGGELGLQFTLPHSATLHGVRFGLAAHPDTVDIGGGNFRPSTWGGQQLTANLRNYDEVNHKPGDTIIAVTVPGTAVYPAADYFLPFASGPLTLPAGTYVVTVNEPVPPVFPIDGTLNVYMHAARYQPGTGWAKWPSGGDWVNLEDISPDFARTLAISLVTGTLFDDGFESAVRAQAGVRVQSKTGPALPGYTVAHPAH